MTTTLTQPAAQQHPSAPGPRGSLLLAEAHRFWSRRFIRLLVLLGAVGYAAALFLASTQFAQPSPEGLAQAQQRLEQVMAEQEGYRQQCLPTVPLGQDPESYCGPPATAENFGGVEQFIDKQPFSLAENGPIGAVAVAAATAAFAFVIGATWIGAEWSSRSIVALLFWEPRRLRVLATKTLVLVAAVTLLAAAAQAVWLVAARVLAGTRGVPAVPAGFWGDLAATAARGVLLSVLVGLIGLGIAHLARNTAAALGVGFVYTALVENAVRVARPRWQEWLLTNNAAALVQPGGAEFYVFEEFFDASGTFQYTERALTISNLHGGLVVTAAALGLLLLGLVLFQRRDLG